MNKKNFMLFRSSDKPLFVRILVSLTVITVIFWFVLSAVARQFLRNAMWSEFSSSVTRTMEGISRQSINDIKYADYFQIQRTLQGFYDEDFMKYLAIYTSDGQLLAMFPRQIGGEDYMFMERMVLGNASKSSTELFTKNNGDSVFHFQKRIDDENGEPLGFIAAGGTMAPLGRVLGTQTVFFTIFGFVVLALQIGAIGYASLILMRPLNELTKMLKKNEEVEPEKFLPALMTQKMPHGASSEVNLFYKVYQKLLQNIQAHQMHSQEMAVQASIGRIASHIAHDMRTPISVLKGFTESVPDNGNPDVVEYKVASMNSVEKLDRMADDLVDYAKAKQVHSSPVLLRQLFDEVARGFTERLKEKGAKLGFECREDLVAHMDIHKMDRVLSNMVQNAIHALPASGGNINITAHITETGWLAIRVEDSGKGIDPKHLTRLFDSSFTFGKLSGSGLGLSYCKNVVEAHGGRILVESILGRGSAFTIEMPMSAEKLTSGEAAALQEAPVPAAPESARSILVVDDDPAMLVQWKQMLEELTPFEIVTAKSPAELKSLDPSPDVYRAAICDYRFEGEETTGLDLIRYLKEKGICCRYLCTGFYYDPAVREEAIAAGAHAIIPKPIPEGLVKQLFG